MNDLYIATAGERESSLVEILRRRVSDCCQAACAADNGTRETAPRAYEWLSSRAINSMLYMCKWWEKSSCER